MSVRYLLIVGWDMMRILIETEKLWVLLLVFIVWAYTKRNFFFGCCDVIVLLESWQAIVFSPSFVFSFLLFQWHPIRWFQFKSLGLVTRAVFRHQNVWPNLTIVAIMADKFGLHELIFFVTSCDNSVMSLNWLQHVHVNITKTFQREQRWWSEFMAYLNAYVCSVFNNHVHLQFRSFSLSRCIDTWLSSN